MFSSIVSQFCESLGGIFGQIPFLGDLFSQVCSQIVSFLQSLGL